MKTTEEKLVNWEAFDTKNEDRLKLETGKKYELGFSAIRQDSMEVEDKEKTAEGTVPVKKKIPVLILTIDYRDGKPAKMELLVSSKRLAQDIRAYFQKDMLFKRVFEITREGEGMQTKYRVLAMEDKPAPPTTQGGEKSTAGKGGNPSPAGPDSVGAFA